MSRPESLHQVVGRYILQHMFVEIVVDQSLRDFQIKQLKEQAEAALARYDRAAFMQATKQLKELIENE